MNIPGGALPSGEVYSIDEIARAAGAARETVAERVDAARISTFRGYLTGADAIRLVRALVRNEPIDPADRAPVVALAGPARRGNVGLATSGALHVGAVAALVLAASLGWLDASTSEAVETPSPVRLVFLSTPGPGGGGGGGGLKQPRPALRAQRKSPVKRAVPSPVPEVAHVVPPPRPDPPAPPSPRIEPPRIDPPKIDPPPVAAPPVVQAPVAARPADDANAQGVPAAADSTNSQGRGAGGGAGSGAGGGLGEGSGSGIGPGSEAGTGGGPYRAGAGIEPPRLLREVKASYTDEARRRGVEGDVVLEIVVRRDGAVGDVRLLRSLGSGLDARAVEAVRQWRFEPARRFGTPVDVIVEVAVQFKVR